MNIADQIYHSTASFFAYDLTQNQEILLRKLCDFYISKDEFPLFLLKGYAGTGKTSLLSAFVKSLQHLKRKTVLLAPTGRAAKVFSRHSDKMAFTIHKRIYRKVKIAGGSIQLALAPNLHKNTLFLVDEVSMIGDYTQKNDGTISPRNLLDDLINYVYQGKGCKLIFIGDIGQLPPVGTDFSPALDCNYMQNNYPSLSIFDFQLTEVLRQAKDSDILRNATDLRSAKEEKYPSFKIRSKHDLFRIDGRDLQDEYDSALSNYGREETIVITRSNKRANLFNQEIRSRIFKYEEKLVANDLLMVVRNNYYWLGEQSKVGFIANGESLEIVRVKERETNYGFEFVTALIRLIDYPDLDTFEVKIMLDVLDTNTPNLPREKMKILFFEVEKEYAYERNKRKRYELVMANPYFNALQVKYAYAVTCHKSQGGQWGCVFIDQGFLTDELLDKSFFRWLYTAFTRATDKLYLINFNPQFFVEND